MDENDFVDGCDLDFRDPSQETTDENIDVLVMFADVWDDEKAVEQRRADLLELGATDV